MTEEGKALLELILKILTVFVPLIIGTPVYISLKQQINKLKAEALAAEKKADLDEATTAKIYHDLSKDAGEELREANTEVKTAETRIHTLEKLVVDLNNRLTVLTDDRARLENEVVKRDARIDYLQGRVTTLERILEANHIDFPPNGGMK